MEMSTRWGKEITWRCFLACSITILVVREAVNICNAHSGYCKFLKWGSLIWFKVRGAGQRVEREGCWQEGGEKVRRAKAASGETGAAARLGRVMRAQGYCRFLKWGSLIWFKVRGLVAVVKTQYWHSWQGSTLQLVMLFYQTELAPCFTVDWGGGLGPWVRKRARQARQAQ